MHFVELTMVEHGCSTATHRALIKAVNAAVAETLNVPIESVLMVTHVLDPGEYGIGGDTVSEIWAARAAEQERSGDLGATPGQPAPH